TVFEHWIKPRRRCCCVGRARSCSFQSPACFVDLPPRNSCLSLLCAEAFARCESENLAGLEEIEWTSGCRCSDKAVGHSAGATSIRFQSRKSSERNNRLGCAVHQRA